MTETLDIQKIREYLDYPTSQKHSCELCRAGWYCQGGIDEQEERLRIIKYVNGLTGSMPEERKLKILVKILLDRIDELEASKNGSSS